jgi:hypothetical protein
VSDSELDRGGSRWQFIRDVVVFQLKLVLDGLRDAMMIPVSIAAAVVDLLVPGPEQSGLFYRIVALGRNSEAYIDLFEAADRVEPRAETSGGDAGVDELFRRVEGFLREQDRKGGLTSTARVRVDKLLDVLSSSKDRS